MEGWMIALIAVGGVLLILLLVLFFGTAQLRISCRDSVRVRLRVLGLRFRLYPREDGEDEPRGLLPLPEPGTGAGAAKAEAGGKTRTEGTEKEKKEAGGRSRSPEAECEGKPGDDPRTGQGILPGIPRKNHRPDPAAEGRGGNRRRGKTALIWGGVSASASLLLNWINDHYAYIDHEPGEVDIRPDFAGSESGADIDLVFSLGLWSALRIALLMRTRFAEEKARAHIKAVRRLTRKAKKAVNQ